MVIEPFFTSKQEYREYAKKIRADLDIPFISKKICENLKNQDFFKFSQNILAYFPMKNEIDIKELFEDTTKNWYLPKVEPNKSLFIYSYKFGDPLVKSKHGVYEPIGDTVEVDPDKIDVAIIPALMTDHNGYRLGYGAGYYDRFLPGLKKDCIKITLIPEELIADSIPFERWDIPVNKIITPYNTFYV